MVMIWGRFLELALAVIAFFGVFFQSSILLESLFEAFN